MFATTDKAMNPWLRRLVLLGLAALLIAGPSTALGKKKKSEEAAPAAPPPAKKVFVIDESKIVWPSPPEIARIKYLDHFSNQKLPTESEVQAEREKKSRNKKKASWMLRMAGGETVSDEAPKKRSLLALAEPYGIVTDSHGNLYVADGKVSAVFIFNTETKDLTLIPTSPQCRFGYIIGLAIDDDDTLYVSDSQLNRVDIFDAKHQYQGSITQGIVGPGGLAIDSENRFLYVVATQLDQVLVFDLDTHKLLRRIGTGGEAHKLTSPGDFAMPTNAAVDSDGNLYVTDTWNDRVEVFDADGNFIRAFGKNGDGPGTFARPKGIAIDSDNHIWVADSAQDTVQIFDPAGRVLLDIGGHGKFPGSFSAITGIWVDRKSHRVFTSEDYPGRVQMFQYITQAEARAEFNRRKAEKEKAEKAKEENGKQAAQEAVPASSGEQSPANSAGAAPAPVAAESAPEKK